MISILAERMPPATSQLEQIAWRRRRLLCGAQHDVTLPKVNAPSTTRTLAGPFSLKE